MSKTEYMNTLKEELIGLPANVIEETIRFYENQFAEGMEQGKSKMKIAQELPKPRLVAAQKKAGAQYQRLKKNITPNHFFGLMIAFMGVMVFNFFMIIPAVMYGVILFVTYIASFSLYGAGTIIMAASLSGVSQMQVTIPEHHHSFHHRFEQKLEDEEPPILSINLNKKGLVVVSENRTKTKVNSLHEEEPFFQSHHL